MKRVLLAIALFGAAPAWAGLDVPPIDPTAQINAAIANEAAARNAAIVNATPAPCTAPLPDTYAGSAGIGAICMARPDATRPTVIKSATVLTASDGTFSGNWVDGSGNLSPFASAPTGLIADIPYTTGMATPYKCSVTATATGFSGKCWQLVTTTLPSIATSLLGLVVSPVANATSGLSVRVTGRQ